MEMRYKKEAPAYFKLLLREYWVEGGAQLEQPVSGFGLEPGFRRKGG
jgi:hypothetical protein